MRGKIYIGGLLKSVKKPDVERAFSRFGKLKEVWLAHNPPGFAFVHYVFPEDADDAIRAMDGRLLSGAKIRVESAKSMGRRVPNSRPASKRAPPPPRYRDSGDRGDRGDRGRARLPPPPPSRRGYSPPYRRSLSPPPSPIRRRLNPPLRRRSPLPPPPPLPPLRRRSPLPMSRGRSPPSPLPLRRKGRPLSPPGSWSPPPPLPRDSYSRSDPPRYRDERSSHSQYTADRVPYISFDRRLGRRSPLGSLPPPPPLPPPGRYRSRSPVLRRRSPPLPPLPPLPARSRYTPPPLPPPSSKRMSATAPKRYLSPVRIERREKRQEMPSNGRKPKRH